MRLYLRERAEERHPGLFASEKRLYKGFLVRGDVLRNKSVLALIMIMATISFLGFAVENIWLSVTKGFIDNRNMLFPFLIGYGFAIIGLYWLFGTPMDIHFLRKKIELKNVRLQILVYFLLVMVYVSVGEILLGKLVEVTCEFEWWDYSRIPLHITQYTSIPTSMGFAAMIVLFMAKFFEPLYAWFMTWDDKVLRVTAITLFALMMGDFIHSAYLMYTTKSMQRRWKIDVADHLLYWLLHQH